MKTTNDNQDNVKTIRKKIRVISKNPKKPPADISFEEWLLMGKKMGWDLHAESIPMIVSTYEKDNDQLERHSQFLNMMTKIYVDLDNVICKMEQMNSDFKTADKEEIFDSQMLAQAEILKGVTEHYRTGAIEQKQRLYEEQAYLVYARYRNDRSFKKHIDAFLDEKEEAEVA